MAPSSKPPKRSFTSFLLVVGLAKLCIYLSKLFEDGNAVSVYSKDKDYNFMIISVLCFIIPALVYVIFLTAGYLCENDVPKVSEMGTNLIHGILLIPWQIKSRIEVLYYVTQRLCHQKKLSSDETVEVEKIQRQADVLEFFEDFYAGFLQMALQVYLIIMAIPEGVTSKFIIAEAVVSGLTLFSLLTAIRRKDDGPLNFVLSFLGWFSMFTSRVCSIALAAYVLHGWITIPILAHAIGVSIWVYRIALDSYNPEIQLQRKKSSLFLLVFTLFGLPSLIYWPIMFQLKDHHRPLKFLLLVFVENTLCFIVWAVVNFKKLTPTVDLWVALVVIVGTISAVLFLSLYICCKPKYTDNVALHHMEVLNAESFGSYFDFCRMVFNLPKKPFVEENIDRVIQEQQTSPT